LPISEVSQTRPIKAGNLSLNKNFTYFFYLAPLTIGQVKLNWLHPSGASV
jgi:hypothetical protein